MAAEDQVDEKDKQKEEHEEEGKVTKKADAKDELDSDELWRCVRLCSLSVLVLFVSVAVVIVGSSSA